MEITAFAIEEIKDPTNIIEGKRFEFLLDIEVDEEDELYTEAGVEVRVIVAQQEDVCVLNYFLIDKGTNDYLDFALEEDEEAEILAFITEQLTTNEENAGE